PPRFGGATQTGADSDTASAEQTGTGAGTDSGGAELDQGHVGRGPDSYRRPPETRAIRDIYRHTFHFTQSAHDGLAAGPYEQVERHHLPAVGVPGQLQVDPVPRGVVGLHGLV